MGFAVSVLRQLPINWVKSAVDVQWASTIGRKPNLAIDVLSLFLIIMKEDAISVLRNHASSINKNAILVLKRNFITTKNATNAPKDSSFMIKSAISVKSNSMNGLTTVATHVLRTHLTFMVKNATNVHNKLHTNLKNSVDVLNALMRNTTFTRNSVTDAANNSSKRMMETALIAKKSCTMKESAIDAQKVCIITDNGAINARKENTKVTENAKYAQPKSHM